MPSSSPSATQDSILSLIVRTPSGVTLDEISRAFSPPLEAKALKSALNTLADEGLIASDGAAHDARYVSLITPPLPTATAPAASALPSVALPGSTRPRVAAPVAVLQPMTPPPKPSDADFEPMFDLAAPVLISTRMPRSGAIQTLRTHALRNKKTGAAMAAYVDYATQRLEAMTDAEAAVYGITADELAAWRVRFRNAANPSLNSSPAAPSASSL